MRKQIYHGKVEIDINNIVDLTVIEQKEENGYYLHVTVEHTEACTTKILNTIKNDYAIWRILNYIKTREHDASFSAILSAII